MEDQPVSSRELHPAQLGRWLAGYGHQRGQDGLDVRALEEGQRAEGDRRAVQGETSMRGCYPLGPPRPRANRGEESSTRSPVEGLRGSRTMPVRTHPSQGRPAAKEGPMRTACILSASLLVFSAGVSGAQEPRFRPDVSFPDGILYASIASVSRLEERLAATLLGRMATHPGVRKAFEGFAGLVKEKAAAGGAAVERVTGKTPFEILGLIRGEVALYVGVSPDGRPAVAIALELGPTREEILEVRGKLRAAVEDMSGTPLEKTTIEGVEATAWPGPTGPILDGVVGTHLVIASFPDLFKSIAEAHRTKPEPAEPREMTFYPDLARDLAVTGREALLLLDLEAVRGVLLEQVPEGQRENLEKAVRVAGLDRLSSLGGALGFREGGAESCWRLAMKDGPGGILGAFARSLPGIGDLDGALGRIPAGASEVQAGRIDIGGLLRGIDAAVREVFPEHVAHLDSLYEEVERNVGISVQGELFTLGEIAAHSFSIRPPAGGLFPDEIALVESRSAEPYAKVLEKAAAQLGAKPRAIGPAGSVTYLNVTDGSIVEYLREALLGSRTQGFWTPSGSELLFMASGPGVASADMGEGWTALSALPQAVVRHLETHSKGPRLASAPEGAELASLLRREAKGAAAVVVSRGGSGILAVYNSILPVANAAYPILRAVGIDPAELPPAEAFSGEVKPGYLRLAVDAKGFTLRGHRVLETRAGVLAGVGAAAFAAGFLVPTLQKGRGEAYAVQCQSNLKILYTHGIEYSDKSGTNVFPYSEAGSVAALQALIDFRPDWIEPALFSCPSHGGPAPAREGGRLVLTPDTTSYEVVPWRVSNRVDDAIWLYDRAPVHEGHRNVLFSDGSVRQMDEAEFQKALAENRERFSKDEPAPKKTLRPTKKAKKKAE